MKTKVVKVSAEMTTDLSMYLEVPADMDEELLYEMIRHEGLVEGGDMQEEPNYPNGDWNWGTDFPEIIPETAPLPINRNCVEILTERMQQLKGGA